MSRTEAIGLIQGRGEVGRRRGKSCSRRALSNRLATRGGSSFSTWRVKNQLPTPPTMTRCYVVGLPTCPYLTTQHPPSPRTGRHVGGFSRGRGGSTVPSLRDGTDETLPYPERSRPARRGGQGRGGEGGGKPRTEARRAPEGQNGTKMTTGKGRTTKALRGAGSDSGERFLPRSQIDPSGPVHWRVTLAGCYPEVCGDRRQAVAAAKRARLKGLRGDPHEGRDGLEALAGQRRGLPRVFRGWCSRRWFWAAGGSTTCSTTMALPTPRP